ncbi:cation transporter [Methanosarcinales archaeon]|nr:MAG: cation transporter [Methanosarcinales archaeon]
MDRWKRVRRILLVVLALNLLVALLKGVYGYITGSVSMMADGLHSLFDAFSTVVALIGVLIASKPPDPSHPYGHGKFETLGAMGIGILLLLASFEIFYMSVERMLGTHHVVVSGMSFGVMVFSMGVNLGVSMVEEKAGKEYSSDALLADAKHTRADFLVSLSVIVSLMAAKFGHPILDLIFGMGIAVLVAVSAIRTLIHSSETLCDRERINPEDVRRITLSVDGVKECSNIRSRGRRDEVYMDMCVGVDGSMSVEEAHKVAQRVEDKIKKKFREVADVVVHIKPVSSEKGADDENQS